MHRVLIFVASVAVATIVAVGSAGAQTSIDTVGPAQIFNGFVNSHVRNATIRMSCAGPIRPGDVGHPAAGQTLQVARALDLQPAGNTGAAHGISVDLRLRFPIPHTVHLADFSHYGTKKLPTSIEVPCAGDGHAIFTPIDGGTHGRSVSVHVSFVGQP